MPKDDLSPEQDGAVNVRDRALPTAAAGRGQEHVTLVQAVQRWFAERSLTDAVVGYSGGIDSTVVALLLNAAGVRVHLVVAEAPNQRYASPAGGEAGACALRVSFGLESVVRRAFNHADGERDPAFHEAALPIMRNALFYGRAATLRSQGRAAVVVGTTNLSEGAYLGFWGKASDAAQDVYPISHLTKGQVYDLARCLGAPAAALGAPPSGDLLFASSDDHRMIGATYPQIDRVIHAAEADGEDLLMSFLAVDDLPRFVRSITRNSFKYQLPFPGFHLCSRLETFRRKSYPAVLQLAHELACSTS